MRNSLLYCMQYNKQYCRQYNKHLLHVTQARVLLHFATRKHQGISCTPGTSWNQTLQAHQAHQAHQGGSTNVDPLLILSLSNSSGSINKCFTCLSSHVFFVNLPAHQLIDSRLISCSSAHQLTDYAAHQLIGSSRTHKSSDSLQRPLTNMEEDM